MFELGWFLVFIRLLFHSRDIHPNIVMEARQDLVIYGLVSSGHSVAITPLPLAGEPYNVKPILISDDIPQRDLYLIWNKDSVADETIFQDIEKLSDYRIKVPEGLELSRIDNNANFSRPGNNQSKGAKNQKQKNNFKNRKQHNK